ncbi:MAG: BON domain-containing protein [Acidobacteriota bacterium]
MKKITSLFLVVWLLAIAGFAVQEGKTTTKKASTKESVDCSKVDDAKIAADVKEKFANTKTLKDAGIEVAVQGGKVTLTGKVQKGATKGLATRQAKRVSCVKDVVNEIAVESAPTKSTK